MLSVLTWMVVVSSLFTLVILFLPSPSRGRSDHRSLDSNNAADRGQRPSVQIVVLGDIGRSPRMQYHALSVAKHGGLVQLIGYLDSEPLPALLENPGVILVPLPNFPRALQTSNRLMFIVLGPLKVLLQVWTLWVVLGYRTRSAKWMLIQNPPSIPTLAIAAIICTLRSTRLVIDWHNFGYSILGLKLGPDHPFVRFSKLYEIMFAKAAYAHLTVTNAMARVLKDDFSLKSPIMTLHDRPAAQFQPLTGLGKQSFLTNHPLIASKTNELFMDKMKLLVSSTSWTPDEDFSILLEALCIYSEKAISTNPQLPEILAIVTGKGPQKDMYLQKVEQLRNDGRLEMVTFKTAWLSFEEYAKLLGAADLGVSLHTSSSGVDLPMKVVDMFGAGLPVVGWSKFEAWPELVTEGVNGQGFSSAEQFADILIRLFDPYHIDLNQLKKGALLEGKRRWDEEWDPIAGRLFGLVP